ncbi:hypothetical protein HYPSUDRAFT_560012 [Hypholoma sublateritium FD-334 SS-4]|uniref:Uncharacterized protein n=1 Tax=Hypholoma sublateritium (strain FD-334 SS-4) TaxID=945553 RepID=A0A0D2L9F5_HYPSF|nr:hypothetical protein HYPSUDRAFT_560012 [Hypholoma sublateritium FD-334 SS-4]
MTTSLKTPPDPPPYIDPEHTEDTHAEAPQSHDQSRLNQGSMFDDVMTMSRTAVKSLDVDRLVQYGQTTFEGLIKPNVLRLIYACDDDPHLGSIIAAPLLLSLIMATTFLALAFSAAILSILVVTVIAGTVMMLGMLQSLLVKLAISALRNLEIPSLVQRVRETSRKAVDHVRGSKAYPYIAKSPVAVAFIGFTLGAHMWIIPALIAKSAHKQVPLVRKGPVTILTWRPWRSRAQRNHRKWRKILTGITKAMISIAVVFFKVGRAFLGRIVSKLAEAVRLVFLGLVRIVYYEVCISLKKTSGIWPMICIALFLYCLLLHHRTNKLAKKVDGGRRRRRASQHEEVEPSRAT